MTAPTYETYPGNPVDGNGRHIAVSVNGIRVAGAAHLRQRYDRSDPNTMAWQVVPVLRLHGEVKSFRADDEDHARQWLSLLAGLYCATAASSEDAVAAVEPVDVITEADVEWGEPVSAAELDDAVREYWDEVESCCGGTDFWCAHYRSYPPVAERW